ncbi:MAG: hypothetical protein OEN50_04920 [Deltaproteobacteria bacterium]|nr:hypothetical protein [Deltaproteobacteria bacterium]
MTQARKSSSPKVTIIASKGANQAINYLLEDRDELDWLVAIGRNKKGDIFFYDTGGDVIQDLGALEYIKERILRDYFGDVDE